MKNIVIIGSTGHAKVIIDILELERQYKIIGLIDRIRMLGKITLGYNVIGVEEDLPQLIAAHDITGAIVAIGDNYIRHRVTTNVSRLCPELSFVNAIHPRATIGKDVAIGDGSVMMAGVTVNACCRIGRSCILNTNSSLDHDSTMMDFSSLAPGVETGGDCEIGEMTAIGIGATLSHGIHIGAYTVIGAGSVVLHDIGTGKIAYGSPARVRRDRTPGDKYL